MSTNERKKNCLNSENESCRDSEFFVFRVQNEDIKLQNAFLDEFSLKNIFVAIQLFEM